MSLNSMLIMPFLIALQFLTTIPVRLPTIPSAQQNAWSILFYPVIGTMIGGILYAMAFYLSDLPLVLLSSLILVVWIWLTGGLHLDGLADSADAWVGGFGDRERTLAIMKDPACGPIGVISIVVLCMLKWSSLYVLLQQQQYWFLIFVPMLGRLSPLFLFLTTPYVRNNGLGTQMMQYLPKKLCLLVFIVSLLFFIWIGQTLAGLLILIFLLALCYLRHKMCQRLGGMTGDTIGASVELIEMLMLLNAVLMFYT